MGFEPRRLLAWAALAFFGCATGAPAEERASREEEAARGPDPAQAAQPVFQESSQLFGVAQLAGGQAENGATCSSAAGCASGFCVDGVCCDSACGGGVDDCQSCSTAKGAATDGVCGFSAAGTVCRNANGTCDIVETCSGTSTQCPPDKIKPAGTVCRNAAGFCDVAETCNGVAAQCPFDNYAPAGTVCRNANGTCDIVETCSGSSTQCPPDKIKPAGTVCRGAAGACDVAETCNGVAAQCPFDNYAPAGVSCRSSAGFCDVAESCTGSSTQCPQDAFKPAGTMCRNPNNHCDVAETCSGAGAQCPPDAFAPAGTVCRNANGGCDAVETCTGTSTICPPDKLKSAGTVCRTAVSTCDVAETCSGASLHCPPDGIAPAGTVCRSAAGSCDVAETCSGASLVCPGDVLASAGTVCRASTGECDAEETCSGSAAVCPADAPSECCPAAPACDPTITISPSSAALVVTRSNPQHAAFLDASFKLGTVLQAILDHSDAPGQTATDLYQRLWDTLRTAAQGAFTEPFAPHCTDAGSTINGFPADCPRSEGAAFGGGSPDVQFRPVALFNRFDLAPVDGSHCGEYRIVYAEQGVGGRVLVILEGQLPNPAPECGIESCRPVAELWRGLPALSASALGAALQSFYFDGLPGFRAVIHPESYGFAGGSGPSGGQIRVNMFHDNINWQLRELHLDRGCNAGTCRMFMKPVTDKNNPFGDLFNSSSSLALADDFREELLDQVPGLAASTVMGITMNIPDVFNTGQSNPQTFGAPDNYVSAFTAGGGNGGVFGQQIQARLTAIGSSLTPANIVARALSQSCAGCHDLSAGANLGGGLVFPPSQFFVHVNEDGGLSPALTGTFLPHRANVLATFLQACTLPPPPQLASLMSVMEPAGEGGGPVPTLGGSVTH